MTAKRRDPLDEPTPYHVVLDDGVRVHLLEYEGPDALALYLHKVPRFRLDQVLRVGSRPGVNPEFILQAFVTERDRRIMLNSVLARGQRQFEGAGRNPDEPPAAA